MFSTGKDRELKERFSISSLLCIEGECSEMLLIYVDKGEESFGFGDRPRPLSTTLFLIEE